MNAFREGWLAFRAVGMAKRIVGYAVFMFFFAICGFLSGLLIQLRKGGLFGSGAALSIADCLKTGFLSWQGILITVILLLIICLVAIIAFSRRRSKPQVAATDENGTNYSDSGSSGSMHWMSPEEARAKFEVGDVKELFGYIYGKMTDGSGDIVTFKPKAHGGGNRNTIILGQPGTGKSFSLIRNEMIQAIRRLESFVCTDPKGELFTDTYLYTKERCDHVWSVNFLDPEHSSAWNIIRLIVNPRTERIDDDRLEKFANTYLVNATTEQPDQGEFWYTGALNLFQAIIALLAYEHEDFILRMYFAAIQEIFDQTGICKEIPPKILFDKKYSLVKAENMFRKAAKDVMTEEEVESKIEDIKNSAPPFTIAQVYYETIQLQNGDYDAVGKRISILPASHPAVVCFTSFKSDKVEDRVKASTAQGLALRMSPLRNEKIRRMLSHDDVDIAQFNRKRCAVYLIVPDNTDRYKSITALFFKFMFDDLSDIWDRTDALCKEKGVETLSVLHPVSVIMDEFANIGQIPDFDKFMSTGRGRKINVTIALQHLYQLHQVYGDKAANTIKNNCDIALFLGTNDEDTAEWMSTFILGVTTVITQSYSSMQGRLITTIQSENVTESERQRYLMYISELRKFDDQIIVGQHGKNPLRLDLFGFIEHPEARWFHPCSIQSAYVPMSKRFPEVDPLLIAELKEIERRVWENEKMRADAEGREAVFQRMVEDKNAILQENRYRILNEIKHIVKERMGYTDEEEPLNLSDYETEEILDIEDLPQEEEKPDVIDSTYREVEEPKKAKKRKRKKTASSKPAERPADLSELNDD